jgi:hypothetical protein
MKIRQPSLYTAAVFFVLLGCGQKQEATSRDQQAAIIAGVWNVEFTLRFPLRPWHMPQQQTVRGQISLLEDSSLREAKGLSGRPTHVGTYNVRFDAFELTIPAKSDIPEIVGIISPSDSVEFVLQPDSDEPLKMSGHLAGDSIAGVWTYNQSRVLSASGDFVMRHP